MNSIAAGVAGLDCMAAAKPPAQVRSTVGCPSEGTALAGFAGLLTALLGTARPAQVGTATEAPDPAGDGAPRGGAGTCGANPALVRAGLPLPAGATAVCEGITGIYSLATTGRSQSGLEVGRDAVTVPQAADGGKFVPPGLALDAARSDLLAGLLPLGRDVAAGVDAVSFEAAARQLLQAGPVAGTADVTGRLHPVTPGPLQAMEAQGPAVAASHRLGVKSPHDHRPAQTAEAGAIPGGYRGLSTVRAGGPGAGTIPAAVAVDSASEPDSGQGGRRTEGARAPERSADGAGPAGPAGDAQGNAGQPATGGSRDGSAASPDGSGHRRTQAAGVDRLDTPTGAASADAVRVETGPASAGKPRVDQVISAVAERVESARSAGRDQARFEIRTDDGQAIDVRISVHRTSVSARIGVPSAELRDALAGRIWELGQRLESGGLTPESIEVVVVGGWSEGSHQGGQRRQPRRRAGDVGEDAATASLVDAERREFERWA